MIHASLTTFVRAPADAVTRLYLDYRNWPRLFGATIRSTRMVRQDGDASVIEVGHIEGPVINVLRQQSPNRIELREYKRRYDATFLNVFTPAEAGTLYTLDATISLKWPYRLLQPFLSRLVRSRMRRYVLDPVKQAAEGIGE